MPVSYKYDQHMTDDGTRYATLYNNAGKTKYIASRTLVDMGDWGMFGGCKRECACVESMAEIEIFEIVETLNGVMDGHEMIDVASGGRFMGKKIMSVKTWEEANDKVEELVATADHDEGAKELADALAIPAIPAKEVLEKIKVNMTNVSPVMH